MHSFKKASYKTLLEEQEEEVKEISCNQSLQVSGNDGIYEVDIVIGTETGPTGVEYIAEGIPDRFELYFDGKKVADSKFVGDALGAYKDTLVNIKNQEFPVFQYNGEKFVQSNRTETISVTSSDIANGGVTEPTKGTGKLRFDKNKASVTTMTLRITGVLGSTAWNVTPICPNGFPAPPPGGGGTTPPPTPPVRQYILTHFPLTYPNLPYLTCSEFEGGLFRDYYSTGTLTYGSVIYTDKGMTQVVPSGVLYTSGTVFEVTEGVITYSYPCFV